MNTIELKKLIDGRQMMVEVAKREGFAERDSFIQALEVIDKAIEAGLAVQA